MFIRRTRKSYKGKSYTTYLLVESVHTPKGPRQKVICSLGNLTPAPREHWLGLAHKVEAALAGQLPLREGGDDAQLDSIVEKTRQARSRGPRRKAPPRGPERIIAVDTERVEIEQAREAGPVHVAHQLWRELGVDRMLCGVGFSERSRMLTEAMVLNRLIFPLSEHAMPEWIRRTALEDILNVDFTTLTEDALYRNLDRLHPNRARIEAELAEREQTLFNLDDTVYLYDLTSTYFEGLVLSNSQAQRGYSRDRRPDCKQVLVGLVLNRDGFPKAHEIFDGNRQDRTTVAEMLDALEERTGRRPGTTVVVDRGMAYAENLEQITARGFHYIVAGRQPERIAPRNPGQKKSRVLIKRQEKGEELYVLCVSEGREEKDRAIRHTHEQRLVKDLQALQERIEKGYLKDRDKIHQAIGRLKERYPRVARYDIVDYDAAHKRLAWREDSARKTIAQKLDGGYVLKTDRRDLTAEDIWRIYILLTRVEAAFRAMKSPLLERPIFHHLRHRTQTHIFLCVLAYHLLVSIEKRFLDHGIHTSWWTLRQQLSTHQVVTVALPTTSGAILKIRKATTPEPSHREIYSTLGIPQEVITPLRTWHEADA